MITSHSKPLSARILIMLALILMALSATAQDSTTYRVDLSERDVQQVTIEARFRGVVGENFGFSLTRMALGPVLDHRPRRYYVRH